MATRTAEGVAEMGRKADVAIEKATRAATAYSEALEGLSVRELQRLARLRGKSLPHGQRSRDAVLARLR